MRLWVVMRMPPLTNEMLAGSYHCCSRLLYCVPHGRSVRQIPVFSGPAVNSSATTVAAEASEADAASIAAASAVTKSVRKPFIIPIHIGRTSARWSLRSMNGTAYRKAMTETREVRM